MRGIGFGFVAGEVDSKFEVYASTDEDGYSREWRGGRKQYVTGMHLDMAVIPESEESAFHRVPGNGVIVNPDPHNTASGGPVYGGAVHVAPKHPYKAMKAPEAIDEETEEALEDRVLSRFFDESGGIVEVIGSTVMGIAEEVINPDITVSGGGYFDYEYHCNSKPFDTGALSLSGSATVSGGIRIETIDVDSSLKIGTNVTRVKLQIIRTYVEPAIRYTAVKSSDVVAPNDDSYYENGDILIRAYRNVGYTAEQLTVGEYKIEVRLLPESTAQVNNYVGGTTLVLGNEFVERQPDSVVGGQWAVDAGVNILAPVFAGLYAFYRGKGFLTPLTSGVDGNIFPMPLIFMRYRAVYDYSEGIKLGVHLDDRAVIPHHGDKAHNTLLFVGMAGLELNIVMLFAGSTKLPYLQVRVQSDMEIFPDIAFSTEAISHDGSRYSGPNTLVATDALSGNYPRRAVNLVTGQIAENFPVPITWQGRWPEQWNTVNDEYITAKIPRGEFTLDQPVIDYLEWTYSSEVGTTASDPGGSGGDTGGDIGGGAI